MREKEQQGDGKGGGQSGKQKNANRPANKSQLPGGLTPGEINKTKPGATQEWGSMKEKERENALTLLKEKFPERYKELVEQYMKALAEQGGPGSSSSGAKKKP
jgi:hypothetical protein